jgi:hypothetical protein
LPARRWSRLFFRHLGEVEAGFVLGLGPEVEVEAGHGGGGVAGDLVEGVDGELPDARHGGHALVEEAGGKALFMVKGQ